MDKGSDFGQIPHIALRLDDVGAASKRWNMHSPWTKKVGRWTISGNWLFLKALPPFRGWAPYREMTADDWLRLAEFLTDKGARMTVAVTAAWVRWSGDLIPFPERFPKEAASLLEGVRSGVLEIATHGLTHCVLQDRAFRPRLMTSNRSSHREFNHIVPVDVQADQLRKSLDILQTWLGKRVEVFVPPGNEFIDQTVQIAGELGLSVMTGTRQSYTSNGMTFVGDSDTCVLHDRDYVVGGIGKIETLLRDAGDCRFCFVSELAGRVRQGEPASC